MIKKVFAMLAICLATVIYAGCSNDQMYQVYEVLEKTAEKELQFVEQQDLITDLEKQENELYEKIISLGMKEFDEVVNLSNEALEINEKRKELIEKEHESIVESKTQFDEIDPLIENLDDENIEQIVNDLRETMEKRFQTYEELYIQYLEGLNADKELYLLLQEEEASYEDVQKQIKKINDSYNQVIETNKLFNNETEKYNELKLKLYEQAGLIKNND